MTRDEDDFFAARNSVSVQHAIGEPLDAFSLEELARRVALLRAEIERIDAEIHRKKASLGVAAAFFKKGST